MRTLKESWEEPDTRQELVDSLNIQFYELAIDFVAAQRVALSRMRGLIENGAQCVTEESSDGKIFRAWSIQQEMNSLAQSLRKIQEVALVSHSKDQKPQQGSFDFGDGANVQKLSEDELRDRIKKLADEVPGGSIARTLPGVG